MHLGESSAEVLFKHPSDPVFLQQGGAGWKSLKITSTDNRNLLLTPGVLPKGGGESSL